MAKGSEIARYLAEHPREPEDEQSRRRVRLRADTPSLTVEEGNVALEQLHSNPNGVVLRSANGNAEAIVLSPDRYAELTTAFIKSKRMFLAAEGRIQPRGEDLDEFMVEETDTQNSW